MEAWFFLFFFTKMAMVNQEAIEIKRSHLTNRKSFGKQTLSASSRIHLKTSTRDDVSKNFQPVNLHDPVIDLLTK